MSIKLMQHIRFKSIQALTLSVLSTLISSRLARTHRNFDSVYNGQVGQLFLIGTKTPHPLPCKQRAAVLVIIIGVIIIIIHHALCGDPSCLPLHDNNA
jgi:hypothetical protein